MKRTLALLFSVIVMNMGLCGYATGSDLWCTGSDLDDGEHIDYSDAADIAESIEEDGWMYIQRVDSASLRLTADNDEDFIRVRSYVGDDSQPVFDETVRKERMLSILKEFYNGMPPARLER